MKLLMEVWDETNHFVAIKRLDLAKALIELDDIEAKDDYKLTITTLLEDFGTPLSLAFIGRVLPDGEALAEARKSLREPNEEENRQAITVEYKDPEDKTRLLIKLRPKTVPIAEQQSPAVSAPTLEPQQAAPAAEPQPAASTDAEAVVTAPAVTEPATAA